MTEVQQSNNTDTAMAREPEVGSSPDSGSRLSPKRPSVQRTKKYTNPQSKVVDNTYHMDKTSPVKGFERKIITGTGGSSPVKGVELVFKDICVNFGQKLILNNVSGMAKPGELLAIMGPSGAGKTTLLNTLAGRKANYKGEVTVDGSPMNKAFKRKLCYVLQQDVFFPNLTLKETLTFTAMIRLPDSMSRREKLAKVTEIVSVLDLDKCLDTIMGDMWSRGLSGGEKKRANIACELLTDPVIIFLDEPTSGLDYSTAFSLIHSLKLYAKEHNKTVVSTIHQPSSFIFYQFNNLLLMSEGEVAYFGETEKVAEFFSNAGIPMTRHYNPADFILEKLKEDEKTREKIVSAAYSMRHSNKWPEALRTNKTYNESQCISDINDTGDVSFSKMKNRSKFSDVMQKFIPSSPKKAASDEEDPGSVHISLMGLDEVENTETSNEQKWRTGFITQYTHLTIRTFRQSKSVIFNKYKIVEAVIMCVLVSLIWFQLPRTEDTLRDRMGVIFFMSMNYGFTPLFDTVTSFPSERMVINKERAAGWYRLSAYYMAKMTSELPLILTQPVIFGTIVYWSVGLNGLTAYCATLGTLFIHSIAGQSVGLFLGIACMDIRKAMTIATVCIMVTMLLGGFYTRHLPPWLTWLKYTSFLYYTFHCLMYLEFTDAPPVLCSTTATNISESQFASCLQVNGTVIPSLEVLKFYEIDWMYWQYLSPLFIYILVFRVAGYFILRFVQSPQS